MKEINLLRLKNLNQRAKTAQPQTSTSQYIDDEDFDINEIGSYSANEIRLLQVGHTVDQIENKLTATQKVM